MQPALKSILLICFLGISAVNAQESADTLLAKDNVMIPLPTVSVNFGFNHMMSDVKLVDGPSPFRQFGYQLSITQRATKFLNVTLDLYTGTVYGEEQRNLTNINFRTTLFSQHLNLEYNFYPLLKPDAKGKQLIRPYLGIGVGAIFFRSKGDLKDDSGNDYNYWSDGLIYAETEGSVNQSEATPLTRDFEYETDLRDANMDGLRKYSQTAFSLPLNAGIRFQISKNIGVNAAFAYAFNFSDMLDNVSDAGAGDRLGTSRNDNHLYGSIGLSVFLGTTKPSAKPTRTFVEELADEEVKAQPGTEEKVTSIDQSEDDDLASISKRLIEASESIVDLAEASDVFITEKSNELGEITNRNLESKKDLRSAKKESIAILDSSIAALRKTDSGLKEASNKLNSAYTDFTDKKVDTRPAATNKVRNTVESKIPAIESLKSQIESAKSPEELKSVLNITSKNLTHTNEIFKNESSRMNESILTSRKAVIEARVDRLESNFLETILSEEPDLSLGSDSPSTIAEELETLYAEGMLSEAEYNEFKNRTSEIDESLTLAQQPNAENNEVSETDRLASTTELLKTASETVSQKTTETERLLSTYQKLLNALSEEQVTTKSDLGQLKKQALALVEQSSTALATTNKELNSVADNLNQVSQKLNESEQSYTKIEGTNKLKSTIESIVPRLDASKTRIETAKSSKDLNQILAATSKDLENTTEILKTERNRLAHTTLKTRKEVVKNRLALLSSETSSGPDELSSVSAEIESLKQAKMLSDIEMNRISVALGSIKDSNEESKSVSPSANDSALTDKVTKDEPEQSISELKLDETANNASPETDKTVTKKAPTTEEIENTPPKPSAGFHWADVNENGWISPDEVLHFIDLLFDGDAVRSVEDIQNLIDYYFDQE